jgi:6-phosphogluconolactonase
MTPEGFAGENLGGHLEWPRGDRAYVTTRGHDSVVLIDVDLDRGGIAVRQHVPSGGRSPRHFLLLDDLLVVAHEKDGAVTSFFRVGRRQRQPHRAADHRSGRLLRLPRPRPISVIRGSTSPNKFGGDSQP